MQGLSFYRDKTVIISAAATPLGRALCHRLADLDAMVVALGSDESELNVIARHNPSRIQSLQWTDDPHRMTDQIAQVWGAEPLHLLVSVLPFRNAELAALRKTMRLSRALVAAVARGLQAGRGCGVLLYDDAGTGGRVARRTAEHAFAKFAGDVQRGHPDLRLHALSAGVGWSDGNLDRAVDLVLMLGHPVASGLAPAQLSFAAQAD